MARNIKTQWTNVMRCVVCYHLYNLKNVKNTHGGVLLLVKVRLFHGCFSRFSQIVEMVANCATHQNTQAKILWFCSQLPESKMKKNILKFLRTYKFYVFSFKMSLAYVNLSSKYAFSDSFVHNSVLSLNCDNVGIWNLANILFEISCYSWNSAFWKSTIYTRHN